MKNIISFMIPIIGLLSLGYSFHILDNYDFKPVDEEHNPENDSEN